MLPIDPLLQKCDPKQSLVENDIRYECTRGVWEEETRDVPPKEWDTTEHNLDYDSCMFTGGCFNTLPMPQRPDPNIKVHHMECEDKTRFLLHSEDGKAHCLRLVPDASQSDDKEGGSFHHCSIASSEGNQDGYQTMAESYKCDEGTIRMTGTWGADIQDGYLYEMEMGRFKSDPNGNPRPVDAFDKSFWNWCPKAGGEAFHVQTMCGMKKKESPKP